MCRGIWLLGRARCRGRQPVRPEILNRVTLPPRGRPERLRYFLSTLGERAPGTKWVEPRGAAQHLTTQTKQGSASSTKNNTATAQSAGRAGPGHPEALSRRAALRGKGSPSTNDLKAELGRRHTSGKQCSAQGSRTQLPEGNVAGRLGTTSHTHLSARSSALAGRAALLPLASAAQAHPAPLSCSPEAQH